MFDWQFFLGLCIGGIVGIIWVMRCYSTAIKKYFALQGLTEEAQNTRLARILELLRWR